MADIIALTVRVGSDGPEQTFKGRFAWTLNELIQAGPRGVTPLERPAPRWSHYVFRLRKEGVPIQTLEEAHGGAYGGRHGRYVLDCPVTIVREVRQ